MSFRVIRPLGVGERHLRCALAVFGDLTQNRPTEVACDDLAYDTGEMQRMICVILPSIICHHDHELNWWPYKPFFGYAFCRPITAPMA